MGVIKGGDLMLFVNNHSIGYATNHTLNINSDTKETSTKDSGGKWQTSEAGLLSWSASSENLMSNDQEGVGYADLVNYMNNRTPILAVFTLEGNSDLPDNKLDEVPENGWTPSTDGYEGTVVITSIELNAPNGENATFTVQFTGVGALYNRKWYIMDEDGNKTLIDESATLTVDADDKYIFWRSGLTYSNSPVIYNIPIPTTSQLSRSVVYKKFSKSATVVIIIQYVGGVVGYQLTVEERNA